MFEGIGFEIFKLIFRTWNRILPFLPHGQLQIISNATEFTKLVSRLPRCSRKSRVRWRLILELEWEGIELVMEDGFEMVKLSKEEEV